MTTLQTIRDREDNGENKVNLRGDKVLRPRWECDIWYYLGRWGLGLDVNLDSMALTSALTLGPLQVVLTLWRKAGR